MKITLTNVRGFEGTHTFSIRPITILIGENSSGKTTLLAAISAALNTDFPATENLFNRAPFELGSFDTIATYRGGKYGRASSFSVGWDDNKGKASKSCFATFENQGGTPRLSLMEVKDGPNVLTVQVTKANYEFVFQYNKKVSRAEPKIDPGANTTIQFSAKLEGGRSFRLQDTFRYYLEQLKVNDLGPDSGTSPSSSEIFDALHYMTVGSMRSRPHATAIAPMRTRPRRTYDDLNEEFKPEGEHIPLILARLLALKEGQTSKEVEALESYGVASGLFSKIVVKRLGKQSSDPFQVRIKLKGPDANLIDVGYGVSQSLPIVIDSIVAPNNEMLLIQQPEVHLHPKAQAALGSFFVGLATNSSKQFVIETHSDYLVDRVRIAVAEGKISESEVSLLYLERNGLDINVHQLELDSLGNITNAPATYREFFLKEEMNLMSRAK